jgi:predicted DNA-binding transcriptional regulator AlpA
MFSLKDVSKATLECFDSLPQNANVRLPVMLCLYGCSRATLYRNIKKGLVPKPHRLGERISAWRVGAVRDSLQKLHSQA